jgi:hypothetical protein
MKKLVNTSGLNIDGKYYIFGDIKEGVNCIFKYVKNFRNGGKWETRNVFIYVHNGVIVANATDLNRDICIGKFEKIKQAQGDYSKITFECIYPLEVI